MPLAPGMSLVQQTLLANGGNTVALSWRLLSDALVPVQLKTTPVFSADEPTSSELFKFEPDTDGGRLTWQPYHCAAKLISDTNGRVSTPSLLNGLTSERNVAIPGTFTFNLGRRPSVLIFSVGAQGKPSPDPVIGGFLAELAAPRPHSTEGDYLRSLAAA